MKVALVRGPFLRPNGVLPWEYVHNNFDDIDIVAFESNPSRFDTSVLNIPVRRVHWIDGKFSLFNYDHLFSKVLFRAKLPSNILLGMRKIVKDFDVIHTSENFNIFSFQGALWSKIRQNKFVFSAGENIPYPLRQRNFITWQVKKFVNNTASAITATTPLAKKALIHEGVSPNKIEVISNAVDFEYFDKGSKDCSQANLPEELEETFNILFVGRLSEQKGIQYLLRAFRELKNRIKNIRLILIGKNLLSEKYYKSFVEGDKLVYHVRYVPNTEIRHLYNLCDIFILPAVTMPNNEEQFGMTVLEAMACRKPTIVTDVGGLPYIAKHEKTSLVIPERNSKVIADAVLKLYSDKDMRESLGHYSYSYVRENFSKEVIGQQLYEFYLRLIEEEI